jgi:hypothetical protein
VDIAFLNDNTSSDLPSPSFSAVRWRADCKQVGIALVVSLDGFHLGYEVFPFNTHDPRIVQQIVATIGARHGAV